MKVNKVGIGAIFTLYDHESLNETTHKYIVIGGNKKNDVGFIQCMTITSMYNKTVTTEVPIIVNGLIGYVAAYDIHSFKESNFRFDNFGGILSGGDIVKFIELLLDIYKDVNLYEFANLEFHENVKERYNKYVDELIAENEGIREFRMDKYPGPTQASPESVFKKIWYNNEIPNDMIPKIEPIKEHIKIEEIRDVSKDIEDNLKSTLNTRINEIRVKDPRSLIRNCKKMDDIELVAQYVYFKTINLAAYKQAFNVEKPQAFYNTRHSLKREIDLRAKDKTLIPGLLTVMRELQED